jgi:prepilin-type N-terminal cleavage/methylation domain-containing protein
MASRTPRPDAGFTLAEMLAALGILLVGVTALLGALTASISQRRSTDARHEVSALADRLVHEAVHTRIRATVADPTPLDLEFVPVVDQPVPGFPGMTWSARVTADENRPELWLLRVECQWLEGGEVVATEFLRVVPRQLPLRDRVLTFRGNDADTATR